MLSGRQAVASAIARTAHDTAGQRNATSGDTATPLAVVDHDTPSASNSAGGGLASWPFAENKLRSRCSMRRRIQKYRPIYKDCKDSMSIV